MKPVLAHVKLEDIFLGETNQMFRDPDELTEEALKELVDSIKELGVIQPILLRPKPWAEGSTGRYELVAGERRFRAAKIAGLITIPANIQDLSDEEAFNVQVTENLQRKDVHPLKEANAYKYLVDKDPVRNTPAELAAKFGKTEHYIQTRLALNNLVDEGKKDLRDGIMTIGHALLLARLQPDDQKTVIEHCRDEWHYKSGRTVGYDPIGEVKHFIETNIMCNLSSAAFKKDDASLYPQAGPCTSCQKRSGANQLFSDITARDRCFDSKCFMEKRVRFVAQQLPSLIERNPDMILLADGDPDPILAKVLKDNGIIPLRVDKDFSRWGWDDDKMVKGLYVSGDQVGKTETVYLKVSETKNGKDTKNVSTKNAIARIEERVQRGEELDAEKVYAKILDALKNHPTQSNLTLEYYNPAEDAFLNFVLLDLLGDFEDVLAELGIKPGKKHEFDDKTLYAICSTMDTATRLYILRRVMLEKYGSLNLNTYSPTHHRYFLRQIAEGYKDIPIADFEAEQAAIAKKRRDNADKRIAKLKAEEKKTRKKKTKTPAPAE
jgi:ParB/RepB/Spo0J family partition protein